MNWTDAVKLTAAFYLANVHTYQGSTNPYNNRTGRKLYDCPGIGAVYDDCSSFVTACTLMAGIYPKGEHPPTASTIADKNSKIGKALAAAGFTPLPWPGLEKLLPFDILANGHHAEVFAGYIGDRYKSYSWGNLHDMSKGGMPSGISRSETYTTVWRLNGIDTNVSTSLDGISAGGGGDSGGGGTLGGGAVGSANVSIEIKNEYAVHEEYNTYSGKGGNIFENGEANAFSLIQLASRRPKYIDELLNTYDSSIIRTRIYSTNDSLIVLDTLTLPLTPIKDSSGNTIGYEEDNFANMGVTKDEVDKFMDELGKMEPSQKGKPIGEAKISNGGLKANVTVTGTYAGGGGGSDGGVGGGFGGECEGSAAGFSSQVTNELMKKVLTNNDTMLMGALKGHKLAFNDYHGKCTSGPQGWYAQAGISMSWWKSTSPCTIQMTQTNLGGNFTPVWHGTISDINALSPSSTPFGLRPGDVATLYTGRSGHQHGEMWTGKDWRSDCILRRASCYGSSNLGAWSAVIWRCSKCQEPGMGVLAISLPS